MNTIKSDEASNYRCCTIDRACIGEACMAWKKEFVLTPIDTTVPLKHRRKTDPSNIQYIETGLGYCGMVNK